jgi:peroxiredoxin
VPTLCLLLIATMMPGAAGDEPGGPAVGTVVPGAVFLDPNDRPVALADYHRPVLVLNFFAFWCDTWLEQWTQLRELVPLGRRLSFDFVSVSIDGQCREQLKRVCKGGAPPFPVLYDPGSHLARRLAVRRVPTVIVLDRDRRITYVHEGYPGNAEVLKAVRAAFDRAATVPPEEH